MARYQYEEDPVYLDRCKAEYERWMNCRTLCAECGEEMDDDGSTLCAGCAAEAAREFSAERNTEDDLDRAAGIGG